MAEARPVLELDSRPVPWGAWVADVVAHRDVIGALARKDFQTRYKRASLGIAWAVLLPAVQAGVMAFVFSRVVRFETDASYGAYVMSGILAWSYFAATLTAATTAVVDNAGLAEKVWFPRIVVVIAPGLANLVGLAVSYVLLLALLPVLDADIGWHTLLLLPGLALVVALAAAFASVLSALHVYFRDTKFLVQAGVVVWIYLTPIIYPASLLGRWRPLVDLNPVTGAIEVLHLAATGEWTGNGRALAVSLVTVVVLLAAGLSAHRRHDRRFIDLL